jgi:LmbE family N-acetylglucosaminyl deacetylase
MMKKRVLLAIFAHTDDETVVSPVLARYAREGVRVHLVYATDGRHGVRSHFGNKSGSELIAIRRREGENVSRELGLASPIFLDLEDSSLGQFTNPTGHALRDLGSKLEQVIADASPDAIVTWGPDGGYFHPDHCLVHAVVTQVVQANDRPIRLVYFGISHEKLRNAKGPFSGFIGSDARYLTVRVSFTDTDLAAARRSFACHESQFTEDTVKHLDRFLTHSWSGEVTFRPWFGEHRGDDLFQA